MLNDLDALKPKEIIMLGDHLECGGFLAEHHTLGYVAQAEYTFEDDILAANLLLDEIQKRVPRASIDYLEGNHEFRISRWCLSAALRNAVDAAYLLKMHAAENVLHLARRGIQYYKQGKFYDNCRIPATIKRGKCYYTHGFSHGKHAAARHLQKFGACVVFGHVHKMMAASDRTVKDGEIGAWCPGCLSTLQPLWKHTDPTDWTHGYALQLVRKDGDFLHINVPIIEGKSYLMSLTQQVKS